MYVWRTLKQKSQLLCIHHLDRNRNRLTWRNRLTLCNSSIVHTYIHTFIHTYIHYSAQPFTATSQRIAVTLTKKKTNSRSESCDGTSSCMYMCIYCMYVCMYVCMNYMTFVAHDRLCCLIGLWC